MDVEKTIQFLLEQQARFDARQAQYEERSAQFTAQIENVLLEIATSQQNANAILETLTERHIVLAESHAETEHTLRSRHQELQQAQAETERRLSSIAQSHQELQQAHAETERSLKALIATVDRHIESHSAD